MSFDHEEAKKEGFIVPKEGVDSDYDDVLLELADIKKELQHYLMKEKRHFGVSIQFCGSGRKKYQIEVPESQIRKVGSDYELQGSRKGFKKYYTSEARVGILIYL
jgi:DNA mismatch repair protein MSH6